MLFQIAIYSKNCRFFHAAGSYSESLQTSKAELFVKKINGFQNKNKNLVSIKQ